MSVFFMRYPKGLKKVLTFSYDDGVKQDKRLVKLFNDYNLKATFNINTGLMDSQKNPNRLCKQEIVELFNNTSHEVAIHSLTHPWLERLPKPVLVSEIIKDKENIEEMFGKIVRGMAYPFGTTSQDVIDVLRQCDVIYARTTTASNSLELYRGDFLRFSPTCHHNSPNLTQLSQKFLNESPTGFPWMLYVWGHSYEFDNDNNWHLIENLCKSMSNAKDVWFATNLEVFEYILAYNSLIFSANGKIVFNPTCKEIFFADNLGNDFKVLPNQTLKLY